MSDSKRLLSHMRPETAIDQSLLAEHEGQVRDIERRTLLRGSLSLGALTMLTGCDVTNRDAVQAVLSRMSSFNDRVQAFLFSPTRLAQEFPAASCRSRRAGMPTSGVTASRT